MDNWLTLFYGQTRYLLDINDSTVKPDILRFYGGEALSEPSVWDIEIGTIAGVAVGVETGPGAVITGLIGGMIFGAAGYYGADWIADYIDEN